MFKRSTHYLDVAINNKCVRHSGCTPLLTQCRPQLDLVCWRKNGALKVAYCECIQSAGQGKLVIANFRVRSIMSHLVQPDVEQSLKAGPFPVHEHAIVKSRQDAHRDMEHVVVACIGKHVVHCRTNRPVRVDLQCHVKWRLVQVQRPGPPLPALFCSTSWHDVLFFDQDVAIEFMPDIQLNVSRNGHRHARIVRALTLTLTLTLRRHFHHEWRK